PAPLRLRAFAAQRDRAFALEHGAARRGQAQRPVALDVHLEQPGRHQLPEHAAPLLRVEVVADAMGAEPVVAELPDPGGVGAAQDVGEVGRAEALAGAVHAGQGLARGLGAVPGLGRGQAVVAVAAAARVRLAEPAEQRLPAAGGGFAVADQRIELAALEPLALLARLALLDHPPQLHRIAQAVREPGFRGLAVAAGAPGLL